MPDEIILTVNGEKFTANVPARTQLAEILRDQLELTGTHLGCEQGVCGACTVLMNGRPVRACITFANICNGADIQTIEGFATDPLMQKLTESFSQHHALQCGFCTPGMLATAKDILLRFPAPSEEIVRHELSGNLCRCTGYQGIVQAIVDVGVQIANENTNAHEGSSPPAHQIPGEISFNAFEPVNEETPAEKQDTAIAGEITQDGSWTSVSRGFRLNHASKRVWALFTNISQIADCVPGAALSNISGNSFSGAVEVTFGPIQARFGGEGTFKNNDSLQKGHISGNGSDKNGQSRVKGELYYTVAAGPEPNTADVEVQFRFQIQGLLAQFNRPELVTGFVDFLLERFVANCDTVLSGGTAQGSHRIGFFELAAALLKNYLKRLWK